MSEYLKMRPGGFKCRLVFFGVKLWILARWESPEDIYWNLIGTGGGMQRRRTWEVEPMKMDDRDVDTGRGWVEMQRSRSERKAEWKGKEVEKEEERSERTKLYFPIKVLDSRSAHKWGLWLKPCFLTSYIIVIITTEQFFFFYKNSLWLIYRLHY